MTANQPEMKTVDNQTTAKQTEIKTIIYVYIQTNKR